MLKTLSSALVLALASSAATAGDGHGGGCSERSLHGLYVFAAAGFTNIGGMMQPKAIVELIRFNGDGTLSVPPNGATRSIAGNVARSGASVGTYTVDAECNGTLSFGGAPNFDIFVSPRGDDLWMIQTDAGNVFQGGVTRVGR